jgi:hypothetical protein
MQAMGRFQYKSVAVLLGLGISPLDGRMVLKTDQGLSQGTKHM